MARLQVHVLIDSSGSMRGEPIAAAMNGLDSLLVAMRSVFDFAENADLHCMNFDRELTEIQPPSPIAAFIPPTRLDVKNAPSHLGAALLQLSGQFSGDLNQLFPPELCFIFTDGSPTDLHAFRLFCQDRGPLSNTRFVLLLPNSACEKDILVLLSDDIIHLDTASSTTYRRILLGNAEPEGPTAGKAKSDDGHLPPPPPEFNLVI